MRLVDTIIIVAADRLRWTGERFEMADLAGAIIRGNENTAMATYNHLDTSAIIPFESTIITYLILKNCNFYNYLGHWD